MKRELFLEEARLGARDPALIEYDESPRRRQLPARFRSYALVDLAHAVMMVEEGILDRRRGGRLLAGLLQVLDLGAENFPWDARSGSYLVQVEHYLEQRLGEDISGRLQTGRSRNDQDAAADRVFLRDRLLEVVAALLSLEGSLLSTAEAHVATIMPGYTHLQHAQPWTFGHYLLRQVAVFERDLQRVEGAFGRTNQSALGGAALVGTSWPVNRRRVERLLGHEGIVLNASDAGVFARDHLEEGIASLALMMSNLGRLATDLYVWHSWEFSFVEVADGLAATSSIMPQKKNPHALERVKALAGQAIGWLPTIMGSQRGVLSTDLDAAFAEDIVGPAAEGSLAALRLSQAVMDSLIVHADVMAQKAGAFWSTASHLADELVRRFDLPFRTAHHIVGRFVRDSIAEGRGPETPSADLLRRASRDFTAQEISVDPEELRQLLDPRHFIETRISEGSASPRRADEQVASIREALSRHHGWYVQKAALIRDATDNLLAVARALASG